MKTLARTPSLLIAVFVVLLAGLVAGAIRGRSIIDQLTLELEAGTHQFSRAFPHEELMMLTGTPADMDTNIHKDFHSRMAQIRDTYDTVGAVRLLRFDPRTGRVICLVNTEAANVANVLLPGADCTDIVDMKSVQSIIRGADTASPHFHYFGGSYLVTGYSIAGLRPGNGGPVHIVCYDMDALPWRRAITYAVGRWTLAVWLLLGLPLAAYERGRRRARAESSIKKLSDAMDQSESAIMIANYPSCIMEYVNSSFCRLTSYTEEELVGKSWNMLRTFPSSSKVVDHSVTLMRDGTAIEREWDFRRKNGEIYPVRSTVSLVPDGHRGEDGYTFIFVMIDITELRKHEEMLRQAKERAESDARAKGVFMATMSHEVREPLNDIVTLADELLDSPLNPEQCEYVRAIHTSGEALVQLTGAILDFANIESGRMQLEPVPCDLRELVENTLDMLAPRAAAKNIELLHEIDPAVPSHVMMDTGRLRQVLINLAGNAIKFTPSGEVEVTLRRVSAIEANEIADNKRQTREPGLLKLEFSVRDTGIGIPNESCGHLFKPFVQLDSSSARRYEGAGLGLAIAHDIVRLMGGKIAIASEVGAGSTFTFTVQCAGLVEPGCDASPARPRIDGARVAVVTNAIGLRREILRELTAKGAEVFAATLDELAGARWDLAVVDCDVAATKIISAYGAPPSHWKPAQMLGLVDISLNIQRRTVLRQFFAAIAGKPPHHESLACQLARMRNPQQEVRMTDQTAIGEC